MAQLRDQECCICFDPRTEGVVDCRRCVAFVCQTCVAKLSATASCPVCKNPRFVPLNFRRISLPPANFRTLPPTVNSDTDTLVRAVIESNLYRRYGSRAFGVTVNISLNWPVQQTVDVIQQTVDRMNATGPFAQRDPRAAEDVTPQPQPQPQPQRQHLFQNGEYRVSTRGAAGWWRDPNESALPFRVTKVNRSSIHFVNLADDQQRDIHKRVQYDDFNRKYYVPMGQRSRLYDS